jgi:hypothetical protein
LSKRKDRERAESGLIFRDGKPRRKEDWYAIHPTREMRRQQQEKVNSAIATEMLNKFGSNK